MPCLIIGRDGNINELQGGIGVAESDNWNVDVRSFSNGLVVHTGIGDDNQTGFLK